MLQPEATETHFTNHHRLVENNCFYSDTFRAACCLGFVWFENTCVFRNDLATVRKMLCEKPEATSASAPAYLFERDCFVDSFWGALGSDFGPDPFQNAPKSGPRVAQKLSTKQSRSNKYAGADSEVERAGCEAWGVDFEPFQLQGKELIFSPI